MKWFNKSLDQALPWPDVYRDRAKIEIEILKEFLQLFSRKIKEEKKLLEQRESELKNKTSEDSASFEIYMDILADEYAMLDWINDFGEQLSIVGLYRIVESGTKSIFRWLYQGSDKKTQCVYLWGSQHDILKKDPRLKYDLKTTRGYVAMNEIRCLNNVIKHNNGVVDEELSDFPNWQEGDKIKGVGRAFERLASYVPLYLGDLAEKINKSLVSE